MAPWAASISAAMAGRERRTRSYGWVKLWLASSCPSAALAAEGHELANHSFTHPYDLVRRSRPAIAAEIDAAHGAIGACAGRAPVGFRAPGYNVSSDVIDL